MTKLAARIFVQKKEKEIDMNFRTIKTDTTELFANAAFIVF